MELLIKSFSSKVTKCTHKCLLLSHQLERPVYLFILLCKWVFYDVVYKYLLYPNYRHIGVYWSHQEVVLLVEVCVSSSFHSHLNDCLLVNLSYIFYKHSIGGILVKISDICSEVLLNVHECY